MADSTPSAEQEEGEEEEKTADDASAAPIPYSVFTRAQQRCITLLIGLAMMFSGLTANIYLPSVPLLQGEYQTSLQLINVTITAYIVVQGLVPAFLGELSDKVGRRPVYALSFAVYVVASADGEGHPLLGPESKNDSRGD